MTVSKAIKTLQESFLDVVDSVCLKITHEETKIGNNEKGLQATFVPK